MVIINKLTPLIKEPKPYLLSSFDLETHGENNDFLMASICYYEHGELVTKTFYDKQQTINFFKNTPRFTRNKSIVGATNLYFDLTNLLENTEEIKNIYPLIRGGNFITAKWKFDNKYIKFYETLTHIQTSVANLGEMLHLPKLEKPSFLGQIPKDKEEWKILTEYNQRDAFITLKAMEFLQDNYNKIGCNFKITLPSSSMDLFKRKYLKEEIVQPCKTDLVKHYKAYYGGRVEAFKRGKIKDCYLYDINSLYPSMMLREYPNPNSLKHGKNIEYEGISHVSMKCPYMNIPYLPVRLKDKLVFPYGYIKGWYSNFEIREALKLGYELIKIHESIYYTETHRPFKDYVIDMYMKRMENDHIPSMKLFYKILMNSLYGKFGQRITGFDNVRHINTFTKKELNMKLIRGDVKDIENEYIYLSNQNPFIPSYVNPIYSLYTTSYARDYLYKNMPSDVFYMDTDSYITQEKLETGCGLGELKLERPIKEGVIVKPKFYLIDEKLKIKGCSGAKAEDFKNIVIGEDFTYMKMTKFKESIKRGFKFNQIIEVKKHLDLEDNKRKWSGKFDTDKLQISMPIRVPKSLYT